MKLRPGNMLDCLTFYPPWLLAAYIFSTCVSLCHIHVYLLFLVVLVGSLSSLHILIVSYIFIIYSITSFISWNIFIWVYFIFHVDFSNICGLRRSDSAVYDFCGFSFMMAHFIHDGLFLHEVSKFWSWPLIPCNFICDNFLRPSINKAVR